MGDMAEDFKALNKINKERREKNFTRAQLLSVELHDLIHLRLCTEHHWQGKLNGEILDYWPTSSRWRFLGKTHRGKPEDLLGFIRKRLPKQKQFKLNLRSPE